MLSYSVLEKKRDKQPVMEAESQSVPGHSVGLLGDTLPVCSFGC